MHTRSDKLTLASLSAGHFINDSYSNLLSPLLPLLITKLDFNLRQAGILGGALILSSSLMQPVYGYLGDRFVRRAFAVYGPLITAVSMSCLGLAPNYGWLMFVLMIGGMGIASFHPQAAALAAQASKTKRGLGMSIFISSGSVGYGLGPLLLSTLILKIGLDRSYLAAIPGLLVCFLLIGTCPSAMSSIADASHDSTRRSLKSVWKPLVILWLLVVLRSGVQFGMTQFLPLYFTRGGYSLQEATFFLTLFLLSGGLGGFLGGQLADRYGGKRVITYSMLFTCPMLLFFLHFNGFWSLVSLAFGGLALLCTLPVMLVLAQETAPEHTSTVSALMMGFSWGFGGILFVPLTGFLGDRIGLGGAFFLLAMLPLIGYIISLKIPDMQCTDEHGFTPALLSDERNY